MFSPLRMISTAATELNVAWATNEGRRLPVRWKSAHRVMARIKSTGSRTGSRCSRAKRTEDASADEDKDHLAGRPSECCPNGPGVDKGSKPVEAVEDDAPEYQLLHGRSEEYDDQDYRRYGHARALLHPANEPFHKRLLDGRFRRVAEPFENEDADRVHGHAEDYGTDADGHPERRSPPGIRPLGRENPRGAREYPTFLPRLRIKETASQNPPTTAPAATASITTNESNASCESPICASEVDLDPGSIRHRRPSVASPLWRLAEARSPAAPRRSPSVPP